MLGSEDPNGYPQGIQSIWIEARTAFSSFIPTEPVNNIPYLIEKSRQQ